MNTATTIVYCPRCHSTHTVRLFVDRTMYGCLHCRGSFDALLDTPLRDISGMEMLQDILPHEILPQAAGIAMARPYKGTVSHPLALLAYGLGCSLVLFAIGYLLCRGILWVVGR